MDKPAPSSRNAEATRRNVAQWIVLLSGTALGLLWLGWAIRLVFTGQSVAQLALAHFPAVVGLPCAALASLCIVVFLRNRNGPIEFQGLGFTFKGASGQIVLWVICFLAMAAAIKLAW